MLAERGGTDCRASAPYRLRGQSCLRGYRAACSLEQLDLLVDEDEEVPRSVTSLMAIYQNPRKIRGTDEADPFVIALTEFRTKIGL